MRFRHNLLLDFKSIDTGLLSLGIAKLMCVLRSILEDFGLVLVLYEVLKPTLGIALWGA